MEKKSFWVTEAAHGYGTTVEVCETLCVRQTPFQKIEIYRTEKLKKLFLLDGIIQLTGMDEFAYHEMLANVPLFAHEAPRRALVIGGGDGGVLRELSRHEELESIDICEIDAEVIAAAKEFLPETACGFNDPRVTVHIGDGSEFVRDKAGVYDVIIVDSTDPGGPGTPLFGEAFYRNLKTALRSGGIITTQAESPWLLPDVVKSLIDHSRKCFRTADYAAIQVPTYPTGTIGACVASDRRSVAAPVRDIPEKLQKVLRYYNAETHRAAFAHPQFVRTLLAQ